MRQVKLSDSELAEYFENLKSATGIEKPDRTQMREFIDGMEANQTLLAQAVHDLPVGRLVQFYLGLVAAMTVTCCPEKFAAAVRIAKLAQPLIGELHSKPVERVQ